LYNANGPNIRKRDSVVTPPHTVTRNHFDPYVADASRCDFGNTWRKNISYVAEIIYSAYSYY